jgi:hypothetical protein
MRHLGRIACCALAIMALSAGATYAKTPKKTPAKPASTAATPAAASKPAPAPATVAAPVPTTKSAPTAGTRAAPAASTAVVPAADPNLTLVSGMASAGAPRIALEIMDRDQPDPGKDLVGWMSWERERIYIYQTDQAWKSIIERAG